MNYLITHKHKESGYLHACKASGRPVIKWRLAISDTRQPSSLCHLWTVFCHLPSVICLLFSTLVENPLQIDPFLTNKANFPKSQMNVSPVLTKNYEQLTMNNELKNKPNSNPIQTQYKANTNPIQTQYKANSKPIFVSSVLFIVYNRPKVMRIC